MDKSAKSVVLFKNVIKTLRKLWTPEFLEKLHTSSIKSPKFSTYENYVDLDVDRQNSWCAVKDVLDVLHNQIKENYPIKDCQIYTRYNKIRIRWGSEEDKIKYYMYDKFMEFAQVILVVGLVGVLLFMFFILISGYFNPSFKMHSWSSVISYQLCRIFSGKNTYCSLSYP